MFNICQRAHFGFGLNSQRLMQNLHLRNGFLMVRTVDCATKQKQLKRITHKSDYLATLAYFGFLGTGGSEGARLPKVENWT